MAELFDVIFTDLRSSKKSVNRLLSLGVLFALVGHFYVVEPYFHFKVQELELLELSKNVKDLRESLSAIQQQVIEYPAHLRDVKDQIYNAIWSGSPPDTLQIGEISLSVKNKKYPDAVGLYVENWFPSLMNKFKKPVSQLRNFKADTDDSEIFKQAIRKADEAVDNFLTGLMKLEEKDPDIWKDYTVEAKWAEATRKLQKLVENSFDPVKKEIPGLQKISGDNLKMVENKIDQLKPRLNSLMSQIGSVSVRLTDFIVLFPLFIVALLVMIMAALYKSCRLYLAFWHEFSKENTTTDQGAFQQFSDCWYLPPYRSFAQLLLLIALLAVISGMFIRDSLLVIIYADAKLFTFLFPAEESTSKSVFTGGYIFGTLIIVGCFGLIFKTLRRITHELIK